MKREKTTLRRNAAMAKMRLANGFFDTAHERANLVNLNEPECEDEIFYRRVEQLLRAGDTNLLVKMLDRDYMATLDDAARQRYVLTTSIRIQKCVERFRGDVA